MKNIVFVWLPIIIVMLAIFVMAFSTFPVPMEGFIVLLGASISGYTGFKAVGVHFTAKTLPSGEGLSQDTLNKTKQILIALYIIMFESLIIQFLKPEVVLPLDNFAYMLAVCTSIILGGNQAMKHGHAAGTKPLVEGDVS